MSDRPTRFPYLNRSGGHGEASLLPYLPLQVIHQQKVVSATGLLDTGATVNVLPFDLGLDLGLVWSEQTSVLTLTGNLANWPARAVLLAAKVDPFPPVRLAFAWTQAREAPLLLGQINFFMEFDVCFFRHRAAFELKPRS